MERIEFSQFQLKTLQYLDFVLSVNGDTRFQSASGFPFIKDMSDKEVEEQLYELRSRKMVSISKTKGGISVKIEPRGQDQLKIMEKLPPISKSWFPDKKSPKKSPSQDAEPALELKHALSTSENDRALLNKRYKHQGLIGYLHKNDSTNRIALHQVLLKGNIDDYLYYVDKNKEDLDNKPQGEKKTLGYLNPSGSNSNRLRRFIKENYSGGGNYVDHFYCTNPQMELIRQKYHYEEEADKGFESVYLIDASADKAVPLYVYSKNPEVLLFQPKEKQKSPDETSGFSAESMASMILAKDVNEIWWINTRESFNVSDTPIGTVDSYDIKGSSGDYSEFVKLLEKDHLLIGYHGETEQIIGIFQVTAPLDSDFKYYYQLVYKFEKPPVYKELMSLPLFGASSLAKSRRGSLLPLDSKELILEILSGTELNPFLVTIPPDDEDPNPPSIAMVSADSIDGEDQLDIMHDVRAFARVMASTTFKPPLAIALFGKWGSGKSFFMNKLTREVKRYSEDVEEDRNNKYCDGIAQIHFNAWSYLDANLWASIVTKIFEGLRNHFASGHEDESEYIKKTEEKLQNILSVFKQQKSALNQKVDDVTEQLKVLKNKRDSLQGELDQRIKDYKSNSLADVLKNVSNEFDARSKVSEAIRASKFSEDEFNQLVPEHLWQDPKATYESINSQHVFVKELISKNSWKHGLLIALIVILVWIARDYIWTDINFPQSAISIMALIGAIWHRTKGIYGKISPLMNGLISVKNDYEQRIQEAIEAFNQKEKELQAEIENKKTELTHYGIQIQSAQDKIDSAQFKLDNSVATEALHSFIAEKSSGSTYQKHLGIVSTIRRDFEELSKLFAEHNDETKLAELSEEYGNPLQRIILYIDDLDRCPEDRVIEVLEAVNLLMAFQLFIVVVGVDQRWVKNALRKKHWLHFGGMDERKQADQIAHISASDYLEKIFQVPFHLNEAKPDSIKRLVGDLVQNISTHSAGHDQAEPADPSGDESKKLQQHSDTSQESNQKDIQEHQNIQEDNQGRNQDADKNKIGDKEQINQEPSDEQDEKEIVNLELSKDELGLLREMSVIVGSNPRAIKRFVNVYQIARSHALLGVTRKSDLVEYGKLMFLLALPGGKFKNLNRGLRKAVIDSLGGKSTTTLRQFLSLKEDEKNQQIKRSEGSKIVELMKDHEIMKGVLDLSLKDFVSACRFIQRFTFEESFGDF